MSETTDNLTPTKSKAGFHRFPPSVFTCGNPPPPLCDGQKSPLEKARHSHARLETLQEKMLSSPSQLSDRELLCVILAQSSCQVCSWDIANRLIESFGNLENVIQAPISFVVEDFGLGNAQAVALRAAQSLVQRGPSGRTSKKPTLNSLASLKFYLTSRLAGDARMKCLVLFIDESGDLIEETVRPFRLPSLLYDNPNHLGAFCWKCSNMRAAQVVVAVQPGSDFSSGEELRRYVRRISISLNLFDIRFLALSGDVQTHTWSIIL